MLTNYLPIHPPQPSIASQKNQPAIAYPITITNDCPSKNKPTSDRLFIPINSDRPSKNNNK
ncbi:MAG: hypothetical protein ACK46E_22790 [Pseudanabaena sp.]